MSLPAQRRYDDPLLIRYLLGAASEEETDRLDELSIADDEFVWRLRAVENDLVDAYVKGELSGDTLDRFQSFYLSSDSRRDKVQFARSFLKTADQAAGRVPENTALAESHPSRPARRWLFGGVAAAACILAFASVSLLTENRRLKDQIAREHTKNLQHQNDALPSPLAAPNPPTPAAPATPDLSAALAPALVLFPPTRGTGPVPTLFMPAPGQRASFQLVLEADDFRSYRAVLKDPATSQAIWLSGLLQARTNGGNRVVPVELANIVFKEQHYSLELRGVGSGGGDEFIGSYAFLVRRR